MSRATGKARQVLLILVDHVLPALVGAFMAWVLWWFDISRCRGLENWDPAAHLTAALSLHFEPSISWLYSTAYPPLTYFWTNLLFFFMEPGRQAAELSVVFLLVPFSWGSYTLGRVYGGRPAAFLCLIMPFFKWEFANLGHQYLLDLPLITLITLSLLALHRAGDFRRKRDAIILGLILGAGMLVKYNFFFFCGPVLAAGVLITLRDARGARLIWATLLLVAALAFLYSRDTIVFFFLRDTNLAWVLLLGASPFLLFYLPAFLLGRSRALSWFVKAPQQYARVRNWFLTMTLCMVPSITWYMHSIDAMFWMYNKNRGLGQDRPHHELLCAQSLNMPWDFALPMMLIGLALVWRSPLRRELAALAFGGVVTFLFMAVATDCNSRVFFGILPFVLVLATWWLRFLGRYGWLVVALLVVYQSHVIVHDNARRPRYLQTYLEVTGRSAVQRLGPEREEDLRRCKLDRALTALAAELKELGNNPRRLTCVSWDDQQARQYFDCQDLAVKMGLSQGRAPAIFLNGENPHSGPPVPSPDELKDLIVLHLANKDDPITRIQERYTKMTGVELRYYQFRPLQGTMGAHLWRASRGQRTRGDIEGK